MAITLGELAEQIGVSLHGDAGITVQRIAAIDCAQPGDLTFFRDDKYREFLLATQASAVILAPGDLSECPTNALVTDDPYLGYAKAASVLHGNTLPTAGIHPSAQIADDAQIADSACVAAFAVVEAGVSVGEHVLVGPYCMIGPDARIADHARLLSSVTIGPRVSVGRRTIIHPGAVLGADGFGLAQDGERWLKIPQLGSVVLGDDVEIGANTTIDRGALGDTVIEDGVKIDNLVQIGHNVRIGAHSAIAGCAGISGSSTVGRRCKIGGGVGLAGHLQVADDVTITGMTLVTKSITKPGVYSSGWPSREAQQWRHTVARVHRAAAQARGVSGPEVEND
jgi:UDP-3-O-[3-hydroxymyristoyl] glucosamine N-acyltransferase